MQVTTGSYAHSVPRDRSVVEQVSPEVAKRVTRGEDIAQLARQCFVTPPHHESSNPGLSCQTTACLPKVGPFVEAVHDLQM